MDYDCHHIDVMRHCVRAYLESMRGIDKRMDELRKRLDDMRAKLGLMGVTYDKIGSAPTCSPDKMTDGVAELMELEREWTDMMATEYLDYLRAQEMCSSKHMGRHALWLRHVEGREWKQVGREIGYSQRWAKVIADGGIPEVYSLMPEQWRNLPIPNAAPRWRA